MMPLMHFLQSRMVDVRVNLGRRDTGVAQQFLHLPEIRAARQHMRGKTMPHRVGSDG